MHTVDHHLAHLASLGIQDSPPALAIQLPNESRVTADHVLAKAGVLSNFVIIHPGSARIEKFWEAERWAELINHLSERGFTCVLSGGPAEMEQTHIAAIKDKLRRPVIDLSGQVDLLTLTAIIKKAQLLVGVDSAPTHLAAAMQTPQVVLLWSDESISLAPARKSDGDSLRRRASSRVQLFPRRTPAQSERHLDETGD